LKIVGIVPARGGSKGIPKKNLKKIAGKPLIQYTFESALKSKINKIVVSTDDKKIEKFSKSQGIDTTIIRPKSLATDSAKTFDVVKHTINYLKQNENYEPDIVIILQPTSPLRTSMMIDDSIDLLKHNNSSSVISVSKIKTHQSSSFYYKNKFLIPFRKDFIKFDRRQQYVPLYFPTGAIYTSWFKTITKFNSLYGPRIIPLITEQELSIDVDTIFDMFVAEMTILNWNKYLKRFNFSLNQ